MWVWVSLVWRTFILTRRHRSGCVCVFVAQWSDQPLMGNLYWKRAVPLSPNLPSLLFRIHREGCTFFRFRFRGFICATLPVAPWRGICSPMMLYVRCVMRCSRVLGMYAKTGWFSELMLRFGINTRWIHFTYKCGQCALLLRRNTQTTFTDTMLGVPRDASDQRRHAPNNNDTRTRDLFGKIWAGLFALGIGFYLMYILFKMHLVLPDVFKFVSY